ncbi:MAG: polyprenyl synthetase family protein [Opitutales bacterium]|nr:polyprenyl synthetase family protein [Opitutales bacterium]
MSLSDPYNNLASEVNAAEILEPVAGHLEQLEDYLQSQIEAFEPEVQPLVEFTLGHSGKKIRPVLVFLSGYLGEEEASPELVRAAAIVELVHLATLVHDDILDEADLRHQVETVTARYGPHSAVLLGDALFAHALKLAADYPTPEVCRAVAESTRQVCSGEICQTFARGDGDLSLPTYLRIIDLKTAELFAVSARLGARLSGGSEDWVAAAETFARKLGVAYQIYDDLADIIGREDKAGKTLGTDLESGKLTLPVLYYLEEFEGAERAKAWQEMRNMSHAERLQLLTEKAAVRRTHDYLVAELGAARELLNRFPDLPASACLAPLTLWVESALHKLLHA